MTKNLVKLTIVGAVAIFAAAQAHATLVASDDFNAYSNGPLVGNGPSAWVAHSGTTANNVLNQQDVVTSANSQDVNLGLTGSPHSTDALYAGFDVNQTTATAASPSYFAHFKDASTFNFFGRVWVTNAGPGLVSFGIANGGGVPVFGSTVATGTWNRLVLVVDQTGASMASSLYLGPINDPNIGDFTLVAATDIPTQTNVLLSAFALRQASASVGAGTELIDNLLVGTTFADSVVPEPSTVALVGAGVLGLFAIRRRRS